MSDPRFAPRAGSRGWCTHSIAFMRRLGCCATVLHLPPQPRAALRRRTRPIEAVDKGRDRTNSGGIKHRMRTSA
eukprot:4720728-Prymnesium_polylepis.1